MKFEVESYDISEVTHTSDYIIDSSHTHVGFKIPHLIIANINGIFKKFEGKILYNKKSGQLLALSGEIDAASIDTNNEKRDQHLKGAEFLNVQKFPTIKFGNGSSIRQSKWCSSVDGRLTIKDYTRPVNLNVLCKGCRTDTSGNEILVFEIRTTINKNDFGIFWNRKLSARENLIGDIVSINIEGEAKRINAV